MWHYYSSVLDFNNSIHLSFRDCEQTQHFDFVLAAWEYIAKAGGGGGGGGGDRVLGGGGWAVGVWGSHGFQVDQMIFTGNGAITKTGPEVSSIPQYHS